MIRTGIGKHVFLLNLFRSSNTINAQYLIRKMSKFVMNINPINGRKEWVEKPEYYDYFQEVARSSYADMLHDTERNQKYHVAIKKAIKTIKEQGRLAKVLDIGTGTGLLSMMAASAEADSITACEMFTPVAKCAEEVIKANGFASKIHLVQKHSTKLTVGKDGDMKEKANILVAEVFDTELIGEGSLKTFHHAVKHLLEADSIVIPSAAAVYVQIIESDMISKWNKLSPVVIGPDKIIVPPQNVTTCPGSAAVHDVQMSQIPEDKFKILTEPICVFEFDFTGKKSIEFNETFIKQVPIAQSGNCEVVFMWWVLKMDMDGGIFLNNGPKWVQPDPNKTQWRDHWMQAIYYLPESVTVTEGDKITLTAYHDEYSLWFAIPKASNKKIADSPTCNCHVHITDSHARIGMKNDVSLNNSYISMLKQVISPSSVCLCISDGSLLPLMAAKLGAQKVFTIESSNFHYNMMKSYVEANGLSDIIHIITKEPTDLNETDLDMSKVNVLLTEPYFVNCVRPWELMRFANLCSLFRPCLSHDLKIIPQRGQLNAIAVEFSDLWKIRAPLHNVEGFNLEKFDEMIQRAISLADASVEPHPLWEYPCKPLTDVFDLVEVKFLKDDYKDFMRVSGRVPFTSSGTINAVVLWTDYYYGSTKVTTGLIQPIVKDTPIQWCMNCQQGVYFIHPPVSIEPKNYNLGFKVDFQTPDSIFSFQVEDI